MRQLRTALTCVLMACGGDGASDADTTTVDGDTTSDADAEVSQCIFECWPSRGCRDGVVRLLPGDSWYGPCDHRPDDCSVRGTHACTDGCGETTRCLPTLSDCLSSSGGGCDLGLFCAERQPGAIGDPCTADAGCRWPCAPDAGKRYQACDVEVGRCVAVTPPAADLFAPGCGLGEAEALAAVPSYRPVVVTAAACPSERCVVARGSRDGGACANQACTVACAGDDECPEATWCDLELHVCAPLTPAAWPGDCD